MKTTIKEQVEAILLATVLLIMSAADSIADIVMGPLP